jgi:hypothetical protein
MNIEEFTRFKESKAWRFGSREFDYKVATYDCTIHQADIYSTLLEHNPGAARVGGTNPALHFVSVVKSLIPELRNLLLADFLYGRSMIADENLVNTNVVVQDYNSAVPDHNHGYYVNHTYTWVRVFDDTECQNKVLTPKRELRLIDKHWIKFEYLEQHQSVCATPCIFYVFNTKNPCTNIEQLSNYIPGTLR